MRPWSWALPTGGDDRCSSRPPLISGRARRSARPSTRPSSSRARPRSGTSSGRLGALVGSILGTGIAIGIAAERRRVRQGHRAPSSPRWPASSPGRCSCAADALPMLGPRRHARRRRRRARGRRRSESPPLNTLLPAIYVCLGTGGVPHPAAAQLAAAPRRRLAASYAYVLAAGPDARAPLTRLVAVMAGGADLRPVPPLARRARDRRSPPPSTRPALEVERDHRRARGAERGEDGVPRPHVARAAHAAQRGRRVRRRAPRRAGRTPHRSPAGATSTTSPAPAVTSSASSTSCST